ncbi:Fibronectin type III [Trinorchestia longiramus]|nr:Fibronectin type III [Trinorchestia longiramus]
MTLLTVLLTLTLTSVPMRAASAASIEYDDVAWAVFGGEASVSCGITRANYRGDIALVLLHHNDSNRPVYSVDARSIPLHAAALNSPSRNAHLQLILPGFLHSEPSALNTHRSEVDNKTLRVVIRGVGATDAGDYWCRVTYKSHPTVSTHTYLRIVAPVLMWALLVGAVGGRCWWALLVGVDVGAVVGAVGGRCWWALLVGAVGGRCWWALLVGAVEGPRHMEILSSLEKYNKVVGSTFPYYLGSNVTFVCMVTGGSPRPDVFWTEKNEVLVWGKQEADADVVTSSLTLTNITRTDNGRQVSCVATNIAVKTGLSEQLSLQIRLLVTAPPLYVEVSREEARGLVRLRPHSVVVVTVGQRLTLSCEAAGALSSTGLTWRLGGKALLGQRMYSISSWYDSSGTQLSRLSFMVTTQYHNNTTLSCGLVYLKYRGVLEHQDQLFQRVPITLRVIGPPEVSLALKGSTSPRHITEGSSVSLRCSVNTSAPLRSVLFYKNAKLLHNAFDSDTDQSAATLRDSDTDQSAATLQDSDTDQSAATLRDSDTDQSATTLQDSDTDQSAARGKYTCVRFSGSDSDEEDVGVQRWTTFELPLQHVTLNDSGTYACRAANSVRGVVSGDLRLTVVAHPRCRVPATVVKVVRPGVPYPLHCPVSATPSPHTYKWILGDNMEPKFSAKDILLFSVPENYSLPQNVSCYAENTVGSNTDACVLQLEAGGPPGPARNCEFIPSVPKVKEVDLNVVCEAGWTGGLPTNYTILVDHPNSGRLTQCDAVIPIQSRTVEFHVKNLQLNQKLVLTIIASNEMGRSHAVTHTYGPVVDAEKLSMEIKMESSSHLDGLKIIFIVAGATMVIILVTALAIGFYNSRKPKYDQIPSLRSFSQPSSRDDYADQQLSYIHFRNDIDKEALLGQKKHIIGSSYAGGTSSGSTDIYNHQSPHTSVSRQGSYDSASSTVSSSVSSSSVSSSSVSSSVSSSSVSSSSVSSSTVSSSSVSSSSASTVMENPAFKIKDQENAISQSDQLSLLAKEASELKEGKNLKICDKECSVSSDVQEKILPELLTCRDSLEEDRVAGLDSRSFECNDSSEIKSFDYSILVNVDSAQPKVTSEKEESTLKSSAEQKVRGYETVDVNFDDKVDANDESKILNTNMTHNNPVTEAKCTSNDLNSSRNEALLVSDAIKGIMKTSRISSNEKKNQSSTPKNFLSSSLRRLKGTHTSNPIIIGCSPDCQHTSVARDNSKTKVTFAEQLDYAIPYDTSSAPIMVSVKDTNQSQQFPCEELSTLEEINHLEAVKINNFDDIEGNKNNLVSENLLENYDDNYAVPCSEGVTIM